MSVRTILNPWFTMGLTKYFNCKRKEFIMGVYLDIIKRLAFVLLILIPLRVFAQNTDENAAQINKIATIRDGKIGEDRDSTSLAQFRRNSRNNWFNVKRNDNLYFNDVLKLDKGIWLRVKIKNSLQNGNLSLFGNPENQSDTILNEPGRYKFLEDKSETGRVAIEVIHGFAILNVIREKITTITGGLTSRVESGSISRALYKVNPDGSGEIFLQQGHLTFPENAGVSGLQVGQVAQFRDGQITNVFFPEVMAANQYNDFIKYNNKTVWKNPFLKQPVAWIGAAAVVVGTALIVINSRDKKVSGTINISWGGN